MARQIKVKDVELLKLLYVERGWSSYQIADYLDVSQGAVRKAMRRAGIVGRAGGWPHKKLTWQELSANHQDSPIVTDQKRA